MLLLYYFNLNLPAIEAVIIGLFTSFEEEEMMSLWEVWSNKVVVEESTSSMMEWLTAAIIGYIVMTLTDNLLTQLKSSIK